VIIGRQSAAAGARQTFHQNSCLWGEADVWIGSSKFSFVSEGYWWRQANGKKTCRSTNQHATRSCWTQEKLGQQLKTSGMTIDEFRSKITQEGDRDAVLQREIGIWHEEWRARKLKKYMNKLEKKSLREILDPNLKLTSVWWGNCIRSICNVGCQSLKRISFAYDKVWGAVSSFLTSQHEKVIGLTRKRALNDRSKPAMYFWLWATIINTAFSSKSFGWHTSRVTLSF